MMRIFLVTLLCFLFAWGLSDKELAVDINLAGKQRMLTQRMAKDVLMVALDLEAPKAIERLRKDVELFDRTLKGLQNSDPSLKLVAVRDPAIQSKLQKVERLWKPMKERLQRVIEGSYKKEDVEYILQNSTTLLDEMNGVVQALVAYGKKSKSAKGQAINLAGKERMLVQRIAKDRLWMEYDPDDPRPLKDLQKSVRTFERILKGLKDGDPSLGLEPTKAPWILSELHKAQRVWGEYKELLGRAKSREDLLRVAALSDALFEQMNKITSMYEARYNRRKKIGFINSIVNQFIQEQERQKHTINLAGRQRMLTQKMAKEALLGAIGIEKAKNMEALRKDMELFERTLSGFVKGDAQLGIEAARYPEVTRAVQRVREVWDPMKKHIQAYLERPKVEDLSYIVANNEELLKRSNDLVQTFKRVYPSNDFLAEIRKEIIDIAGRQRMLTQKMTKEKLLVHLGVKREQNRKKLLQSVALFDASLHDLMYGNRERFIAKPANKEVIAQFQKVKRLWEKLKPIYEGESMSKEQLLLMTRTEPILLREMDRAVKLCETVVEY